MPKEKRLLIKREGLLFRVPLAELDGTLCWPFGALPLRLPAPSFAARADWQSQSREGHIRRRGGWGARPDPNKPSVGREAPKGRQSAETGFAREARNRNPRPPKKGPPPLDALFAFGSMAPQSLLGEQPFWLNDVLIGIWGRRCSSIAGLGPRSSNPLAILV
jgi:hypothetical protein